MKKYFVKAKYQLTMKVLQAKLSLENHRGEGFFSLSFTECMNLSGNSVKF